MNANGKNILQRLTDTKPIAQPVIFIICVVFLFVIPLIQNIPSFLPFIFLSLLILFSLVANEKMNKRLVSFAFITLLIGWLTRISSHLILAYLAEFTTNMFLFWMVGLGIKRIMRLKEVVLYNLFEAINGFFLLAITFTSFSFFLQKHFPESFHSTAPIYGAKDLVYFTLITLTTTGYGDVLPSTPAAKSLATIMAVSGQFYVAVIMAILVGKYANKN